MELNDALANKRKEILALWVERTLDSYVSPGFFKRSKDAFANPVGVSIAHGLASLFDLLQANADPMAFREPLDTVVRIRAVQEFTPSQALAPFLELKWVVRQIFSSNKETRPLMSLLGDLDCAIDRMTLTAFDIYSACREQLYQNRVRELKSGRAILTDAACPSALIRQEREKTGTSN